MQVRIRWPSKDLALLGLISLMPALASAASHYLLECEIYNSALTLVRRLPGEFCSPNSDGSFLSATGENLTFYANDGRQIWKKKIHAHHEIARTQNGQDYLVMSSELRPVKSKNDELVRFDVLYIINRQGEILRKFSYIDNKEQFRSDLWQKAERGIYEFNWSRGTFVGLKWEFSHTNSFYEIPKQKKVSMLDAFREGNFIVNSNGFGVIFILNREMTKVLWQDSYFRPPSRNLHDIVPLSNGHIMVYNNDSDGFGKKISSIDEYDPVQKKIIWTYRRKPGTAFFKQYGGGVQVLENDDVQFNDVDLEGHNVLVRIDRQGRELERKRLSRPNHGESEKWIQQIKRYDASEFLRNNKSL